MVELDEFAMDSEIAQRLTSQDAADSCISPKAPTFQDLLEVEIHISKGQALGGLCVFCLLGRKHPVFSISKILSWPWLPEFLLQQF